MSSTILVLRHGITQGNKNKWFYGGLDLPLLPEGKEALRRQREQGFYPEVPEHVQYLTTGMLRTEETLETLFGNQEHGQIPNLREMEFGELEGKTFDELKDEPAFVSWTYDETGDVRFPGGESRNDFATRIQAGIEELISLHRLKELEVRHSGRDVMTVLICHGGVISQIMYELFPGERQDMWDLMSEPGCGYIIEMQDGRPVSNCQIGDLTIYYGEVDDRK